LQSCCRHQTPCKKKPKFLGLGFGIKRLAIPYFRMANCHTIIGAKRFHFRVRDGIGWFTLAMVTKQTGVGRFKTQGSKQRRYYSLSALSLFTLLFILSFFASACRLPLVNSFQASAALGYSLSPWPFACFSEICNVGFSHLKASAVSGRLVAPGVFTLGLSPCACFTQTDWVLYGQASRAISTR
jgi:hypothetical protein